MLHCTFHRHVSHFLFFFSFPCSDSDSAFAERREEMMTIRRRSESVLEYKEHANGRLEEELLKAQQVKKGILKRSLDFGLYDFGTFWAFRPFLKHTLVRPRLFQGPK